MRKILIAACCARFLAAGWAATTIDGTNHYAAGANLGWLDWRGDAASGAVIGEYICSGYLYCGNVGWVNLGGGAPTNGIQYQNLSASDFGVNQDGVGNLRGYAYGANIGWIQFEDRGAPRVDLKTGGLSGYFWSANCGWISLSNAIAFVQTDSLAAGVDSDRNGLPDAWERTYFGVTGVDPNADPDRDGHSNRQEYLADTDPLDPNDQLAITAYSTLPGGTLSTVTWKSVPTRCYYIEKTLDVTPPTWFDSGLGLIGPDAILTTRTFADTNAPMRYYRVRAVKPLAP